MRQRLDFDLTKGGVGTKKQAPSQSDVIRALRRFMKLSQKQLAEKPGLSVCRISHVENGKSEYNDEELRIIFHVFSDTVAETEATVLAWYHDKMKHR